jgi:hypothetical protein
MSIYIVDSKNISKRVKCSIKDKIKWIKENFCYEHQINSEIELIFNGNLLDDDETLEDYDIKDGNIINYNCLYNKGGTDEFYLSDDLLDPCYDYDFTKIKDGNKKYYRGGLEYKRPCGWKRYALKVSGKFENDLWLGDTGNSNNDSEWAVSYHGTKQEFADSICKKGLLPGQNNRYGVGVYCTPNIETAAGYSKTFNGLDGKKYKIVFQNRVKPSSIKKASDKGGPDDYWYIENSKDIRPYSICVKKC